MAKEKNQKLKLLVLWNILNEETDENHSLDTVELLEKLCEHGIKCDRKTLYSDIELLNENGFEVFTEKGQRNKYYVVDRVFDDSQIKLMIDAVDAINSITIRKTEDLIGKIASLAGKHKAEEFKNATKINALKYSNEKIYYNIDAINNAINANKKIKFKYFDKGLNGEKLYRKDGKYYFSNPVDMLINDGKYYLVDYSEKHSNYSNYRIDRMEDVSVMTVDRVSSKFVSEFDSSQYRKLQVSMYSGEQEKVVLQFDKSLLNVVYDKFGDNIDIKNDDDRYVATVDIMISQQFFGLIFGLGSEIKILAPQNVVDKFNDYLYDIVALYQNEIKM